jgi:hypothetical protein
MGNFVIEKGELNNVVLTLSEMSRVSNPWFLFIFTNKFSTKEVQKVCSVQSSGTTIRYDLLEINEKSNPNPLLGEVYLMEGEWSYEVYESSEQTIEKDNTTGRVLQRGFIIVK